MQQYCFASQPWQKDKDFNFWLFPSNFFISIPVISLVGSLSKECIKRKILKYSGAVASLCLIFIAVTIMFLPVHGLYSPSFETKPE